MSDDASALHGVWRLKSFRMENPQTGERLGEPMGPNPNGVLMLLPEGRMAAIITPGEQKFARTDSELADAFRKLLAYSGRYRLEPPNKFVTMVDVAWFQPWMNTEQPRTYILKGDRLDVVSTPGRTPQTGDLLVVGILSWERERA